jgi:hypothetical protein
MLLLVPKALHNAHSYIVCLDLVWLCVVTVLMFSEVSSVPVLTTLLTLSLELACIIYFFYSLPSLSALIFALSSAIEKRPTTYQHSSILLMTGTSSSSELPSVLYV